MDVQYTRGQSQDLRDVTARIRAIELFNPDGLLPPVPFVSHPRFPCLSPRPSYVGPHLLRRPRILHPACCLCPSSPRFDLSFFPSQRTFSVSSLAPLLRGGLFYLFHPPPPLPPAFLARSVFCHDALVLALSHSICHLPFPSFHHPSKP